MTAFQHGFADLTGIAPDALADAAGLGALLLAAANAAGLSPARPPAVEPGARGLSAVLVCHGGHVSLHAIPQSGICHVDVAGLGITRPRRGLDVICRRLAARELRVEQHERTAALTAHPESR